MSLSAGTRLGPYEVVTIIGAGGMGEVYRARDTKLNRNVALKILPATFARDPDRLARFQREAQILAALNHPGIAQIYGVEEHRESSGDEGLQLSSTALVMELVDGVTLADLIATETTEGERPGARLRGSDSATARGGGAPRGLPIDHALAIARQIADALDAAHEQGIVHRDLKPANIKVRDDGTVKILDFGLAKAAVTPAASVDVANSPTIPGMATEVGMLLGTAAYMSPEQARGRAVDKRADIWAFGCVFFEMLTGRRLFGGDDLTDIIAAVVREDPDLTDVPPVATRLLSKCLQKDPRRRLRDIGDAWELWGDAGERTVERAKDRSLLSRALPWSLAAAALITLAILGGLALRPAAPPAAVRFQIHAPPGGRLPLGVPAISPDGQTLAYAVVGDDGVARIHLRPIDRVETRVLPGTDGVIHMFWSPDGRTLAFTAGRPMVLKRVDIAGGGARDLTAVQGPWHGAWGRPDDILFLGKDGVLTRIAAGGGPASSMGPSTLFPMFLGDGERFLYYSKESIRLGSLGPAEHVDVLSGVASAPILARTPGGTTYLLYLREQDLMAREFDERSGNVGTSESVAVPGVGTVANPAIRPAVGVSPHGLLAYQVGKEDETGQLSWFDRTGKAVQSLSRDLSVRWPSLSRDGRSVVGGRVAAFREIHVVDLERQVRRRLPVDRRYATGVVWSPDGLRVAVGARTDPIVLVNAASGGVETLRETGSVRAWSPDGRYLAIVARNVPGLRLVAVDGASVSVDLATPRPVAPASYDSFSRDGRYIAVVLNEDGREEVYVLSTRPSEPFTRVSLNGGVSPRWGKDPSELLFLSRDGAVMSATLQLTQTPSASVPRELFRPAGSVRSFGVSADGQRFLVETADLLPSDVPITVVLNWWTELAGQRGN